MAFPVSATLLDALVLSVVSNEDTYGYRITQDVREAMELSESCLLYTSCKQTGCNILQYYCPRKHKR